MKRTSGYLYVLSHPDWPGIVKIGCSRDPIRRLKGLNGMVPVPYKMEWHTKARDMHKAEAFVHWRLRGCRIGNSEFFKLSVENAGYVLATADERCDDPGAKLPRLDEIRVSLRKALTPLTTPARSTP